METSLNMKESQGRLCIALKKQTWGLGGLKLGFSPYHLPVVTLGELLKLSKFQFPHCRMQVTV